MHHPPRCDLKTWLVATFFCGALAQLLEEDSSRSSKQNGWKSGAKIPQGPFPGLKVTSGEVAIGPEHIERLPATAKRRLHKGSEPWEEVSTSWFHLSPDTKGLPSSNFVHFCGSAYLGTHGANVFIHTLSQYLALLFRRQGGLKVGSKMYAPDLFLAGDFGNPKQAANMAIWLAHGALADQPPCEFYLGPSDPDLIPAVLLTMKIAPMEWFTMLSPSLWQPNFAKMLGNVVSLATEPTVKPAIDLIEPAGDMVTVSILYDTSAYRNWLVDYIFKEYDDYFQDSGSPLNKALEMLGVRWGDPNLKYELMLPEYVACLNAYKTLQAEGKQIRHFQPLEMNETYLRSLTRQEFKPDLVVACMAPVADRCAKFLRLFEKVGLDPKAFIITGCFEAADGFFMMQNSVAYKARYFLGVQQFSPALFAENARGVTPWNLAMQISPERYKDLVKPYQFSKDAAAVWTTIDLFVWAIQEAGNLTDIEKIRLKLKSKRYGVLGQIDIDSATGQNVAEPIVVQYQQQAPGLPQPGSLEPGHPTGVVVSPAKHATGPVWHPRPSWVSTECFRSDLLAGLHGLARTITYEDEGVAEIECIPCADGALAKNFSTQVYVNPMQVNATINISVRECQRCAVGTQLNSREITIDNKVFNVWTCDPCQRGEVSNGYQCEDCPIGFYQPEIGQAKCLACAPGKFQKRSAQSFCYSCSQGSMAVLEGSTSCSDCPEGAECPADADGLYSTYVATEGWYRLTKEQYDDELWKEDDLERLRPMGKLFRCPYDSGRACEDGETCASTNGEKGNIGPMCGKCAEGFERTSEFGMCQKCGSYWESVLMSFCNFLYMIMFIGYLVWESVGVTSISGDVQVRVLIVRQMMDYGMMWMVMRNFGNFPKIGSLDEMKAFDAQQIIDFFVFLYGVRSPPAFELATSCYMRSFSEPVASFFGYVSFSFVMIPLWIILILIIWSIVRLLNTSLVKSPERKQAIREAAFEALMTTFGISIWFIHFRILRMLSLPLMCKKYDVERLIMDPSEVCWQGLTLQYETLAVVSFLIMMFVVPAALLFHLKHEIAVPDSEGRRFRKPHVVRQMGFFFLGCKQEVYFYEYLRMSQRTAIVLVPLLPIFMDQSRPVVFLSLSLLYNFMHYYWNPYDARFSGVLSKAYTLSQGVIIFSIISSMLVQGTDTTVVFGNQKQETMLIIRNSVVGVLTLMAHLALNMWFLCALYDASFADVQEPYRPPSALSSFFSDSVPICRNGFGCGNINKSSRQLLVDTVELMSTFFLKETGDLDFQCLEDCFVELILESCYWTELNKVGVDEDHSEIKRVDNNLLETLYPPEKDYSGRKERKLGRYSVVTDIVKMAMGDITADNFYLEELHKMLLKHNCVDNLKVDWRFKGMRVSINRLYGTAFGSGKDIVRKRLKRKKKEASEVTSLTKDLNALRRSTGLGSKGITPFHMDKKHEYGDATLKALGMTLDENGDIVTIPIADLQLETLDLFAREKAYIHLCHRMRLQYVRANQDNEMIHKKVEKFATGMQSEKHREEAKKRRRMEQKNRAKGAGVTIVSVRGLTMPLSEEEMKLDDTQKPKFDVMIECVIPGEEYGKSTGFSATVEFPYHEEIIEFDAHKFIEDYDEEHDLEFAVFAIRRPDQEDDPPDNQNQTDGGNKRASVVGKQRKKKNVGGRSSVVRNSMRNSMRASMQEATMNGNAVEKKGSRSSTSEDLGDLEELESFLGSKVLSSQQFFPTGFDGEIELDSGEIGGEGGPIWLAIIIHPSQAHQRHKHHHHSHKAPETILEEDITAAGGVERYSSKAEIDACIKIQHVFRKRFTQTHSLPLSDIGRRSTDLGGDSSTPLGIGHMGSLADAADGDDVDSPYAVIWDEKTHKYIAKTSEVVRTKTAEKEQLEQLLREETELGEWEEEVKRTQLANVPPPPSGELMKHLEKEVVRLRADLEQVKEQRAAMEERVASKRKAAADTDIMMNIASQAANQAGDKNGTTAQSILPSVFGGQTPSRETLKNQLGKLQAMFSGSGQGTAEEQNVGQKTPDAAKRDPPKSILEATTSKTTHLQDPYQRGISKAESKARKEIEEEHKKADELYEEYEEIQETLLGLKSEVTMVKKSMADAGLTKMLLDLKFLD